MPGAHEELIRPRAIQSPDLENHQAISRCDIPVEPEEASLELLLIGGALECGDHAM